jgi:hypothetical protein
MTPTVSVIHYFTLFWLVGTVALVDLRLLGVAVRRATVSELAEQLSPWTWTALVLSLASGFVMFASGAGEFSQSPIFVGKIVATLVGIMLSAVVFRSARAWDQPAGIPGSAKVWAVASLVVWLGTILLAVEVANYGSF